MPGRTVLLRASDGFQPEAWRADPSGEPRGGVVILQENAGITAHIKAVTEGYAADGYASLAPALYDRAQRNAVFTYGPQEVAARRGMRDRVPREKTVLDVEAAVRALAGCGKVAVIGYCWGGSIAWLAASRVDGIACMVSYYGSALTRMPDERPKCPFMLHWGEKDETVAIEECRKVQAAHPAAPTFYYPAGHAFNNDQVDHYDAASAKLARERTLAFLREQVG